MNTHRPKSISLMKLRRIKLFGFDQSASETIKQVKYIWILAQWTEQWQGN